MKQDSGCKNNMYKIVDNMQTHIFKAGDSLRKEIDNFEGVLDSNLESISKNLNFLKSYLWAVDDFQH